MRRQFARMLPLPVLVLMGSTAWAGPYEQTINLFKDAGVSASFFDHSYGYAVFPTVGEGAIFFGGGHGKGRVFEHGRYIGDASLNRLTFGPQLGGQAYSEIVFFQDQAAFDQFTYRDFTLGAEASAVAVTAAVSATAGLAGAGAAASASQNNATTVGTYQDGVAVFTIAKGGAMFQASIDGEKLTFTPRALEATSTASAR